MDDGQRGGAGQAPARSQAAYYGRSYDLAGIAAASPRYVAFLYAAPGGMFHTAKKVLVSFNGGRTAWQTRQAPPPAGDVAAFAVTPGRLGTIAIAVVTPGMDTIYRSANLGQTWSTFGIRSPRWGGKFGGPCAWRCRKRAPGRLRGRPGGIVVHAFSGGAARR